VASRRGDEINWPAEVVAAQDGRESIGQLEQEVASGVIDAIHRLNIPVIGLSPITEKLNPGCSLRL
jgi:hypothetical protein